MPILIANSFTSYELTDKEALEGSVLTSLQMQVIQNTMASIAEEKIRLEYDHTNPVRFAQAEASLKGQLDILTHILNASTIAAEELANPTASNNL